ncbi:MAG TPA: hypothetical protein VIM71_12665 [Lacunisphaera sp.]
MKIPRFIRSTRLAFFLMLPLALAAKEEVLLDFKHVTRDPDGTTFKCYEYTFGDWDNGKVIGLPGKGALVQASSGKGGLGENKTMVRFDKTPLVDLLFIIGNANQAKAISFGLTDKDGTEQTWQIPIAGLPPGMDQRVRLDLNKCSSEQKPGKTPGMDLKKILTWQVRGDYTDPKVEVLLVQLVGQK